MSALTVVEVCDLGFALTVAGYRVQNSFMLTRRRECSVCHVWVIYRTGREVLTRSVVIRFKAEMSQALQMMVKTDQTERRQDSIYTRWTQLQGIYPLR